MKGASVILVALLATMTLISCGEKEAVPPNVLFIAVDDLRPELGCYGKTHIHSPNIDKLAESGTIFANSYCNIPVCGASRASLLSGLRPTLTRFKKYTTRADQDAPGVISLPGLFKQHGYTTISNGKIFHNANDHKAAWNEIWKATGKSGRDYLTPENIALDTAQETRGYPYENVAAADTAYKDGKLTTKTIRDLKRLKAAGKPFFLAAGYLKPHLPFNAPKKYWDLYPPTTIKLPTNRDRPTDVPAEALHNYGELRHYSGVPTQGQVSDSLARTLIRGYYACISYTDALVGQLLIALEELELEDNTVVILWGDHGWNLMEHGLWCKHCNYRTSLKAPIILRVPGQKPGITRREMVEFVDIYPTLVEACGLEKPVHLEGRSMMPLLSEDPVEWKDQVESVWHHGFTYTSATHAYTRWLTETDSVVGEMLFDHTADPEENQNLIGQEASKDIVESFELSSD